MRELEILTTSEVMEGLIKRVRAEFEIRNKKQAKDLVLNALTYNVVIEEILDQIAWMLEKED